MKNISKKVNFSEFENESNDKPIEKNKISVIENIYEINHKTAAKKSIDQLERSRFFTKKHILDVYLDDSSKDQKEVLHPMITEYNEARRLKYI